MAITKENWEEELSNLEDEMEGLKADILDVIAHIGQIARRANDAGYTQGRDDGYEVGHEEGYARGADDERKAAE